MGMSIPYERSGRTRQKLRTRDALTTATRELIAEGLTPTVESAAARAEISRTAAYRYFPNQRALLVAANPEIDRNRSWELTPRDQPVGSVSCWTRCLHYGRDGAPAAYGATPRSIASGIKVRPHCDAESDYLVRGCTRLSWANCQTGSTPARLGDQVRRGDRGTRLAHRCRASLEDQRPWR